MGACQDAVFIQCLLRAMLATLRSAFVEPLKAFVGFSETAAPPDQASTGWTLEKITNAPSTYSDFLRSEQTPDSARYQMGPSDWTTTREHWRAFTLITLMKVRAGHDRDSSEYHNATRLVRAQAWSVVNRAELVEPRLWNKVKADAAHSHPDPAWAALELKRANSSPVVVPFSADLPVDELGMYILSGTLCARLMEVGSLPAQPPFSPFATRTQPEPSGIRSLDRSAAGALVDRLVERIAQVDTVEQIRSELIAFVRMFERAGQAPPSGRLPVLDLARTQIEFCDTFDVNQAGEMMLAAFAHQPM